MSTSSRRVFPFRVVVTALIDDDFTNAEHVAAVLPEYVPVQVPSVDGCLRVALTVNAAGIAQAVTAAVDAMVQTAEVDVLAVQAESVRAEPDTYDPFVIDDYELDVH